MTTLGSAYAGSHLLCLVHSTASFLQVPSSWFPWFPLLRLLGFSFLASWSPASGFFGFACSFFFLLPSLKSVESLGHFLSIIGISFHVCLPERKQNHHLQLVTSCTQRYSDGEQASILHSHTDLQSFFPTFLESWSGHCNTTRDATAFAHRLHSNHASFTSRPQYKARTNYDWRIIPSIPLQQIERHPESLDPLYLSIQTRQFERFPASPLNRGVIALYNDWQSLRSLQKSHRKLQQSHGKKRCSPHNPTCSAVNTTRRAKPSDTKVPLEHRLLKPTFFSLRVLDAASNTPVLLGCASKTNGKETITQTFTP
jgi:hypothetical protein